MIAALITLTVMGWILGILFFALAMSLGTQLNRERRKHAALPPAPKAICQCNHPYSNHLFDEQGKARGCNTIDVTWNTLTGQELRRLACPCTRYIGPLPLPEYTDTP